jgi:predicted nucleotidyltransferase
MDAYAAGLLARPEVEEVVVFGSFERDTYAPGSDLDVLVVLRESRLPIRERAGEYRPLRFPVPVDLFAFTRTELDARRESPMATAFHASRWRYR